MSGLRLNNICKRYGELQVLFDISLEIEEGEFMVFVGPSGCGKSTLLRMIAGLETITNGQLEIGGELVNEVPPARRRIAMVFQSYALYPHMTVRENMAFALRIARLPKDQIDAKVLDAARMLELEPYLDRLPKALSGGQRQRVAIGRAIVRDPRVFLFDEPLSNLDAALRVQTRMEIAELKEKLPRTTMVYVTHDQVEAMTLAHRIAVLNAGRLEQVGSPLDLYLRPDNEFVARFIGSPAMNLLPGRITGTGPVTTVALNAGGRLRSSVPSSGDLKGAEVNVGIRPEHLRLSSEPGDGFSGRVHTTEVLGDFTLAYLGADPRSPDAIAKLNGVHEGLKEADVTLTASPNQVHLFKDGKSLNSRRGEAMESTP